MTRFEGARKRYDISDQRPVEIAGDIISKTVADLVQAHPIFRHYGRKEAFVSLVTPDYRWGMLAWLRSLRKISDRPVILLSPRAIAVPDDIENVFIVEVPLLYNPRYVPGRPEYADVLTKLWVFALASLDRVAFIDIDCLFLGNVDALFENDQFLAVANNQYGLTSGRFNSGVMAFCPTENMRRTVFRKIASLDSHLGGDEDALNQILLDDVVFIDEKYNLFRHHHFFGNDATRSDIRILHFILKKPWMIFPQEQDDTQLVYLDDLWTSFLSDQEKSELMSHWRKTITFAGDEDKIGRLTLRLEKLEKQRKATWLLSIFVAAIMIACLTMLVFLFRF